MSARGSAAGEGRTMIRIGIMSAAHVHAEGYLAILRSAKGVECVGIADDDPGRAATLGRDLGVRVWPAYDDLLAQRPDGVIVCAENTRHRALVEMAAHAGVHVLCEKPLATTLTDARAM